MAATEGFSISSEGSLQFKGRALLHDVPANMKLSKYTDICKEEPSPALSASSVSDGAFLGFHAEDSASRHVFSMGKLKDTRFYSIFRFKVWWSTYWTGNRGSDLETETQILVLDKPDEDKNSASCPYILFMPIYEGKFRAYLQAGEDDNVDVCVESGSTQVMESSFKTCVYMHACHDPILVVRDAVAALKPHLGTFKMLEEKTLPSIVGHFGWCTWDAFYLTVNPQGIWCAVKALNEGGVPPKFVIIDDGWQTVTFDEQEPTEDALPSYTVAGDQMYSRLSKYNENNKFSSYKKGSLPNTKDQDLTCDGLVDGMMSLKENKQAVLQNSVDPTEDSDPGKEASSGPKVAAGRENSTVPKATSGGGSGDPKLAASGARKETSCCPKGASGAPSAVSNVETLKQEKQKSHSTSVPEQKTETKADGDSTLPSNGHEAQNGELGFKAFTGDLKAKYPQLENVFVWHAFIGFWAGVRPDLFESELVDMVLSPAMSNTMQDLAVGKLVNFPIRLVPPQKAFEFYDKMHSYLANNGISGIKLDVIQMVEMLGEKMGGRVELSKQYFKAVTESIKKNFGGNRVIASMEQCNDFFLMGTEQIAMGRAGDDFWPQDGEGNPLLWLQGFHIVHCAYNSLWLGQFIRPDWDMFQSTHESAPYHAASRAICGGPIYISDFPGRHDFNLLKKLVFPDGTLPRCVGYALPTPDCLFKDPLQDGKTLLKIWNFNKCGGVIGAFNCQGGGWSREKRCTVPSSKSLVACSTKISPLDICWTHVSSFANVSNQDGFVMYSLQQRKIFLMKNDEHLNLTFEPLGYDIYTICPLESVGKDSKFAPIGLLNMINSGGCIESMQVSEPHVEVCLRGQGDFGAYASNEPKSCALDGNSIGFSYDKKDGKILLQIPWKSSPSTLTFGFA